MSSLSSIEHQGINSSVGHQAQDVLHQNLEAIIIFLISRHNEIPIQSCCAGVNQSPWMNSKHPSGTVLENIPLPICFSRFSQCPVHFPFISHQPRLPSLQRSTSYNLHTTSGASNLNPQPTPYPTGLTLHENVLHTLLLTSLVHKGTLSLTRPTKRGGRRFPPLLVVAPTG